MTRRSDGPHRVSHTVTVGGSMTETPEHLHVDFQHAFNRHDLEAIVALYEPDAVLNAVHGPAQGLVAIRDAYRAFLDSLPIIDLQTLGVTRVGELALLQGKWTVHRTGLDGGQTSTAGRSVEVVRLQPDGRWLFVIDNPSAV